LNPVGKFSRLQGFIQHPVDIKSVRRSGFFKRTKERVAQFEEETGIASDPINVGIDPFPIRFRQGDFFKGALQLIGAGGQCTDDIIDSMGQRRGRLPHHRPFFSRQPLFLLILEPFMHQLQPLMLGSVLNHNNRLLSQGIQKLDILLVKGRRP
jgi:hypothetical protein